MLKSCCKKVSKQTCIYLYFHFNFNLLQKYSDINKKIIIFLKQSVFCNQKFVYVIISDYDCQVNLISYWPPVQRNMPDTIIFFLCSKRFALEHKEIPILLWSGVSYEPTLLERLRFGCCFTPLRRLPFNPQPWPSFI